MRYLVVCLFISGCSLGPFHITHVKGHLPKAHVELPTDDCKLRGRGDIDNGLEEVYLKCKWEL